MYKKKSLHLRVALPFVEPIAEVNEITPRAEQVEGIGNHGRRARAGSLRRW